jgi:hypothetical protein
MEEEVDEVVGPKGKHNRGRTAVRHGHESGEVTLGGRRVGVGRPRAQTAEGSEEVALRRTRTSPIGPVGAGGARADARRCLDASLPAHAGARRHGGRVEERSTSRSSVSRTSTERTCGARRADEPPLDDVRLG